MPVVPKITLAGNLQSVVPPFLAELTRWTVWTLIPSKEGKKPAKKPLSPVNDSTTWKTMSAAVKDAKGFAGVGFQMLACNTVVGIDIDNCVNPETGDLSPLATKVLQVMPDTYAEVTPSGCGLRLFASRGEGQDIPEFLSREAGLECYVGKSGRFLTVTGAVLPGREGKYAPLSDAAVRLLAPYASTPGSVEVDLEPVLPVPDFARSEDWIQVFDARRGRLSGDLKRYLLHGDVPGARSEKTYAVACKMLLAHYTPQEVYVVLHSAPGSWEAALDKRDQDPKRAKSLIWADIGRAQKIVRAEVNATEGQSDEWTQLGLTTEITNKTIKVVCSQSNAARILRGHSLWQTRTALDITTGQVLLDNLPLDDARFFDLQETVAKYASWPPGLGRQWWADTLRSVADQNPINPREQWLRSLKWDGTERLNTWLNEHVAAEPDALNKALGRKWLISLVARWLDPGCKCDTVLVLIGKEGTRKTTFFEVMAGGPEKVVDLEGFSRDDKFVMARAWIVEMPEAHILKRADQAKLKAFLTKPTDDYRIPYAAAPVTVRRGFIFVSTSNDLELFQAGQDGLRRFWPVLVRDDKLDLVWVTANREQLLAEAVLAYDLEEQWWFENTPPELAQRQQDAIADTPVDDAINQLVARQAGKGGLGLSDLMLEITGILGHRPNDRLVSSLLPRHGIWKKRTPTHRYWTHPSWENKSDNVVEFKKA
jgi:hypothetical protein